MLSSDNELVAKPGFEMEIETSRPGVPARGPLGTVARRGGGFQRLKMPMAPSPALVKREETSMPRCWPRAGICAGGMRAPSAQGKDEQPQIAEAAARGVWSLQQARGRGTNQTGTQ